MNNKYLCLIGLGFLISLQLFAQEKDFKSWNSIGLDFELTKDLEFRVEQELRFENNARYLGDYITVAGFSYKLSKQLKIRGLYRYSINRKPEIGFETNHRFYGDVILKHSISRFDFSYRFRYQIKFVPPNDDDFTYLNPQHLRHEFEISYNVPKIKLEPFAAIETYQALNNPIQNRLETWRYTLGAGYGLNKTTDIKLFYRIETENDLIHKAKINSILGLSCGFNL